MIWIMSAGSRFRLSSAMVEKGPGAHFEPRIKDILNFDFRPEDGLMDSVCVVNLAKGQALFNQGEIAHSCFVVVSGNMQILRRSAGFESVLAIISKGELGGALLMGDAQTTYPGSVVALTQTCLLLIPKDTYLKRWLAHPEAHRYIDTCVRNRMRFMHEDKILQHSDIESRVIGFHRRHYVEKNDLDSKKVTRKEIALAVGAKTETIIRTLKKLERAGVLETKNSVIRIVDKSYLTRNAKNQS